MSPVVIFYGRQNDYFFNRQAMPVMIAPTVAKSMS